MSRARSARPSASSALARSRESWKVASPAATLARMCSALCHASVEFVRWLSRAWASPAEDQPNRMTVAR
jgi:hypothetical protein